MDDPRQQLRPGKTDEAWFLSQNRALSVAQSLIANGKLGGPEFQPMA